MSVSYQFFIENNPQSPVNLPRSSELQNNLVTQHDKNFEFTVQQQAIIEAAKKSTVRISINPAKTIFDGSGTLVGKIDNGDGSYDYYVLTAAHLSEREGHKVDVRLLNGRVFEGTKFNAKTRDLALIQFTIPAHTTQIPDSHIAIVSDTPPEDQQRIMIAGFPVSTRSFLFKGAKDPVVQDNLRFPAKPEVHPSEGEHFSDLFIDTEAYISLDVIDVDIAKKEAQQNSPFTSDAYSILPIQNGNTAIGMSGGGIWGTSTDTRQPVVYAVHNGRVLETSINTEKEPKWTNSVTRLNRVTTVENKEVETVIMRIRQYQDKNQ